MDRPRIAAAADEIIAQILRAAGRLADEGPAQLTLSIRAVCVRLAEMVADQRHYLSPLPEPQASERSAILTRVADQLRKGPVACELRAQLDALAEMELRATGSWSLVANAQSEWTERAIEYLDLQCRDLAAADRPDEYWANDVVAGIVASVKGIIGADDLHARIEAQYAGKGRPKVNRD